MRGAVRAGDIVARLGGDEFVDPARAARERPRGGRDRAPRARRVRPPRSSSTARPVALRASVGLATAHDATQRRRPRDPRGGHRDAPRQDRRPRRASRSSTPTLRAEVDRRLTRRARPAQRARRRRASRSATSRSSRSPTARVAILRGAAALDAPRLGRDLARRVHPAGRGERPDRPDRRVGARVRAARSSPQWRAGGRELAVSVNLSPRQLADDGVVATVARLLAQTGVPARALCLEVTETVGARRADPRGDAPGRAARARRAHRLRRLRHRLLVAAPPQPAARRPDQARPLLRQRARPAGRAAQPRRADRRRHGGARARHRASSPRASRTPSSSPSSTMPAAASPRATSSRPRARPREVTLEPFAHRASGPARSPAAPPPAA